MWDINWIALFVAALAGFMVGGLWYGPLFGKIWQLETGITEEKAKSSNMLLLFGSVFALNLFAAFILGHVLATYGTPPTGTSMMIAGGIGFGFVATAIGVNYLFSQKSLRLFMIDAGYWIVIYTAMGGIFGVFG
jgi:Protein of unknown function (DUF1761)